MLCSTIKKINNSKHKIAIYLILIVFLAAGLRTIRAIEQSRLDVDAYLYIIMAEDWGINGVEFAYENNVDWVPPLLPYLISLGRYIGLSPKMTGMLIGGVLGSLMPVAIFFIIFNIIDIKKGKQWGFVENCSNDTEQVKEKKKKISACKGMTNNLQATTFEFSNEFLALLGALLIAVHPYMIRISIACMRESLYIPIAVFAILTATLAIKKKCIWLWGLYGILAALGAMTRSEGLELLIIFTLWLTLEVFLNIKYIKSNFVYYLKIILLVMICFWSIVLPVKYYLSNNNSTWSIIRETLI